MDTLVQVLVAVAFIVYSIWSEVNKKKGTGNTEDFSDLGSIDDFFKQQPKPRADAEDQAADPFPAESVSFTDPGPSDFSAQLPKEKRKKKKKKRPVLSSPSPDPGFSFDHMAAYDENAAHDVHMSDADHPRHADVNHDEMPSLEGLVSDDTHHLHGAALTPGPGMQRSVARRHFGPRLRLNRSDLVRGFILTEVLRRYDLERVFERIPQFRGKDRSSD